MELSSGIVLVPHPHRPGLALVDALLHGTLTRPCGAITDPFGSHDVHARDVCEQL